jgi:hypothetical protein
VKLAYDAHPGGCVLVTDAMPAMGRKQKTAGLASSLVPTAWPPTALDRSSRPPLPTPRALVRLAVPPGEGFAIGEMKVDVLGPEDAGSANGRCGKAVLTGTTTLAGSVATMIDCVPTCSLRTDQRTGLCRVLAGTMASVGCDLPLVRPVLMITACMHAGRWRGEQVCNLREFTGCDVVRSHTCEDPDGTDRQTPLDRPPRIYRLIRGPTLALRIGGRYARSRQRRRRRRAR